MQQDSNKKKGKGYRVRPAFARERLNGRTRRVCSILGLAAVVLASAVVVHSLYVIQIRDGAKYRQYAAQQQLLDTTVKATRGEIYDANGITLASTSVVWNIWADPSYSSILYTTSTNDDKTTVRTFDPTMCAEVSQGITLRLLSGDGESLDAVDTSSEEYTQQYQTVYDALSKMDSSYVVLATKVNNAVKLSIEDYVSGFNKAHKKGSGADRIGRVSVSAEKSSQRNYPYGAFAAAVLGFTDGEGVGTYGLEKSYQSTLAGVDGRTITRRNAVGNAIADQNATTFAAKDGSNLVLSLDVNVQEIAERYLTEAVAANNVENRGCAIVMNVKTGAILAMASKPDFDPNTPLDYSANLAYLQEQVAAEPELYTIYLRDENDSKKFKLDENGLYRHLPRYPVEEQGHHRAVLPRQCVQGHHLGHGSGLRRGDHEHHLYLCRCLRRGQTDLPLRRPQGPRHHQHGRRSAPELQHLLHPAGPARGLPAVLQLF